MQLLLAGLTALFLLATPDAGVAPPPAPRQSDVDALAQSKAADRKKGEAQHADPCAPLVEKLEHRKSWLKERRDEQFKRGGAPDPSKAIPDMVGIWCEEHPADEECARPNISIEVSSDELAWDASLTQDDFEPHVLLMRRELEACRAKQPRHR